VERKAKVGIWHWVECLAKWLIYLQIYVIMVKYITIVTHLAVWLGSVGRSAADPAFQAL